MKPIRSLLVAVLSCVCCLVPRGLAADEVTVAAYYFPGFHPCPHYDNQEYPGFTEWDLVRRAKPRFEGHRQPRVPVWGYEDESDPVAMAKKIDAAADYGVDAFIFDWYYYDDGPSLDGALDRGFLAAPNNQRLKFALMWANHDWYDIQGYNPVDPVRLVHPGAIKPETWDEICHLIVQRYFKHPSYWKINGKPYFSIYEISKMLTSFGSYEATRAALDKLRDEARVAGLDGVHVNVVMWGSPNLPGGETPTDWAGLGDRLGVDSFTGYTWVHHGALGHGAWPRSDYRSALRQYLQFWDQVRPQLPAPYFPNATIDWDNSPRAAPEASWAGPGGHVVHPVMEGANPKNFKEALLAIRRRLSESSTAPKVVTINAWNEWPEGSCLEPEEKYGMEYLEAVRDVFGSPP